MLLLKEVGCPRSSMNICDILQYCVHRNMDIPQTEGYREYQKVQQIEFKKDYNIQSNTSFLKSRTDFFTAHVGKFNSKCSESLKTDSGLSLSYQTN